MSTGARIPGRAFAPGTSAAIDAVLMATSDRVELRHAAADDLLVHTTRSDLTAEAAPGAAARKIALGGGWLFESDDPLLETVVPRSAFDAQLRLAERLHPRLALFVIVAIAGVWVIWRYGLDVLVTAAIALTPPVVPDLIDAGTMQTLDLTMAEPSELSAAEQARFRAMFAQLLAVLPDPQEEAYSLEYRDMPGMGPKAFAMPGGTIVLTDEMVNRFGDRPDVIAAVLGHEIGHVEDRHGLRQVYRSLSVFVLIALMAGDVGPILEDVLLEGQLLLSLSYSREHERDADLFGLELSAAAGYDPAALKVFF